MVKTARSAEAHAESIRRFTALGGDAAREGMMRFARQSDFDGSPRGRRPNPQPGSR
jgi:hypothetical protein